MAVINFNDLGGPAEGREGQIKRFVSLAGAATSLALVLGVSIWGYRLVERNVNGIPVIKALQGPLRVAPEDPGGQISGNLGLAVNSVAAGTEDQGAPTDTITLAPAPVTLQSQDVAGLEKKPATPAPAPVAAATGQSLAVVPGPSAAPVPNSNVVASAPVIAPQVTPEAGVSVIAAEPDGSSGATGAAATVASTPAPSDAQQPAAQSAAPVDTGASIASIRPQPRPANIPPAPAPTPEPVKSAAASSVGSIDDSALAGAIAAATASASASVANAAGTSSSVDAASLPAGTRLVQLGAFDDTATAKAEWARLASRFGDVMAGKSRVVQAADSGGHKFYRLRAAGFKDDAEARRFCAALLSENAACVPLRLR